mgnify:CR=1 FL=1
MKRKVTLFFFFFAAVFLSACGAIPTLPPMDSTITIYTAEQRRATEQAATQQAGEPEPTLVVESPVPTEGALTEVPDTATPAAKPTQLKPTNTQPTTATAVPDTPTPAPTATAPPTRTPVPTASATATTAPTPTATAVPFGIQSGSPSYSENFAHPEAGCDWLGVAGQVFDQQGDVVRKVVVRLQGTFQGEPPLESLAVTGPENAYGPGGFELQISTSPADTEGELSAQLFDLDGNPLSEPFPLTTHDNCQKNLILLNFKER